MFKFGDSEKLDVVSPEGHEKIAEFVKKTGKRIEDLDDEEREEFQEELEDILESGD